MINHAQDPAVPTLLRLGIEVRSLIQERLCLAVRHAPAPGVCYTNGSITLSPLLIV